MAFRKKTYVRSDPQKARQAAEILLDTRVKAVPARRIFDGSFHSTFCRRTCNLPTADDRYLPDAHESGGIFP